MKQLRSRTTVFIMMLLVALMLPVTAFAAPDGVTQNVEIISKNLTNPDLAPNMWFAFKFLSGPMQLIQVIVGVLSVAIIFFLLLRVTLDLLVLTLPMGQQGSTYGNVTNGLRKWSSIETSTNYKDYLRREFMQNVVLGLIIVSVISSGLAMTLSAKSIDFMAYALRQVVSIDVNAMMEKSGDDFKKIVQNAKSKYGEVTKDNTFLNNTAQYYNTYCLNSIMGADGQVASYEFKTYKCQENYNTIDTEFTGVAAQAFKQQMPKFAGAATPVSGNAPDAAVKTPTTSPTPTKTP
jgi:hypothetical protein